VRIDQQNRDAIGSAHADALSNLTGDQGVAFAFTILQARCVHDTVRVDLPECDIDLGISYASAEAVF
jgi:hypothetical protein